ncbi:MAG: glycosyltransferase, partial [Pseudohongiellaceae bacterium]
MNATPKIAVLLSTYNGEAFLDIQLQSIVEQTYTNHVIVARDDGSRDGTLALLREWQRQHPERLYLIADCPDNLGARGSFAWLVDYVLAHKAELELDRAYLMFCDQDDRWFPQKMAVEVEAMLAAEDAGGDDLPVLVHSDLRVVTEEEGLIAESFVRYQGLEIARNRFPNMVISNLVTGCTVLINEPLAHKAMPVPDDAIMHDWWLALVAAAFGRVV